MSIILIDNSQIGKAEDEVEIKVETNNSINNDPHKNVSSTALEIRLQYDSSPILQALLDFGQFHRKINNLISGDQNLSFDILIQNERGGTWFGIEMFSPELLMPKIDSPPLTTITGDPVQSMRLFPLKNETEWKWVWKQWYVLMLDDTDDKGWVYSTRFNSKNWRGCYKLFGLTFVRRRIWLRLRRKVL